MMRVLIVDDCKDGADCLGMLLRTWGHEVQVAYDAATALQLAEAFRAEVVLVDIGMPGVDGYCLARQLRGREAFRDALVVAVSGYSDLVHRVLGDEAGFDFYMVKPTDPTALQEVLDRWAGKSPQEGTAC